MSLPQATKRFQKMWSVHVAPKKAGISWILEIVLRLEQFHSSSRTSSSTIDWLALDPFDHKRDFSLWGMSYIVCQDGRYLSPPVLLELFC
jgi:hypothetical protein